MSLARLWVLPRACCVLCPLQFARYSASYSLTHSAKFYRALPKVPSESLSPDTVARVACFLAQNERKSSPYLERVCRNPERLI